MSQNGKNKHAEKQGGKPAKNYVNKLQKRKQETEK